MWRVGPRGQCAVRGSSSSESPDTAGVRGSPLVQAGAQAGGAALGGRRDGRLRGSGCLAGPAAIKQQNRPCRQRSSQRWKANLSTKVPTPYLGPSSPAPAGSQGLEKMLSQQLETTHAQPAWPAEPWGSRQGWAPEAQDSLQHTHSPPFCQSVFAWKACWMPCTGPQTGPARRAPQPSLQQGRFC